jgi:hypothetical protein
MAVRAMLGAGLAAGRVGLGLGRTLAEGRRLAFAGAQALFEAARQFDDLRFEFGHAPGLRLAIRAREFSHADMLCSAAAISCASFSQKTKTPRARAKQVPRPKGRGVKSPVRYPTAFRPWA